jgi:hypothetical protein
MFLNKQMHQKGKAAKYREFLRHSWEDQSSMFNVRLSIAEYKTNTTINDCAIIAKKILFVLLNHWINGPIKRAFSSY